MQQGTLADNTQYIQIQHYIYIYIYIYYTLEHIQSHTRAKYKVLRQSLDSALYLPTLQIDTRTRSKVLLGIYEIFVAVHVGG